MRLSDLSVLVVEDHGFQRRVALRLLEELGLKRVDAVADGRAALAALQASSTPTDIVLVDLDLPEMDGIEFIGHVAQQKRVGAIALTSALDPALLNTVQGMARAYGLRVLGVVEKPLTTSVDDAARLVEIVGARVFVMHIWRYHPGVRMLAAIAQSRRSRPRGTTCSPRSTAG